MAEEHRPGILHCDLDAFFASVEQRDNPALLGKAVVIGGNSHSRGVVSTCSYEARVYGVRSAMPVSQAYRLCPQAVFLPVDMKRYKDASRQVFKIFYSYTPLVEALSIDEAFLDVRESFALFGSAEEIAAKIRKRVRDEVGLSISAGVSVNKFLAKLATELGKPDGLRIIRAEEAQKVLEPLPVSYLWGLGEKGQKSMERMGIKTIGQLRNLDLKQLEPVFGSNAAVLLQLAQGNDGRRIEAEREAKSIGRENTFAQDQDNFDSLELVLLEFSQVLGKELRRSNLEAASIILKLRYHDFKTVTRSKTFEEYVHNDRTIYETASEMLSGLFRNGDRIRLIGLQVTKLRTVNTLHQGSLFFEEAKRQDERLDKTVDEIRNRFGDSIITRASLVQKGE